MPYAKLTITVPKSIWIGEVSRAYPEMRFRVLAATANEVAGVAKIELLGREAGDVCDEIRSYDTVSSVTVFERESDRQIVQIETTVPLLLESIQDSGVPLNLPFDVSNGKMVLETTVPQQRLSQLGDSLDKFGLTYTVERIQQEVEREPLLTDRQYWLLDKAIDRGYYDTPRQTTLTELASDLDMAKSTCSEILHRAEERVLKEFISNGENQRTDQSVTAD